MLRFFVALLVLRIKPRVDIFDAVDRDFRVMPWDLDLNIHLNNAKYLKYLDKGRVEHIIHCYGIRELFRNKFKLIVANSEISYIRSLLPWQKFTVSSRVTHWDHKYVYYEQQFISGGQLYAIATLRLALRNGNKAASPIDAFHHILQGTEPPRAPQSVQLLKQMIQAQRQESTPQKLRPADKDISEDSALTTEQN